MSAAAALASTVSAYVGARNLLNGQAGKPARHSESLGHAPARRRRLSPAAAGPCERWQREVPFDVHLMVFGDSTATGYGCKDADEVPGVLMSRGLAELSGKRIRLSTKAIVGATSKGLSGQVDAMFVAGPPPDAAVIMIGANDITLLNGIAPIGAPAGRRGQTAACQRCRGGRGHLPRLRHHHRNPAAAALGRA